jgi:chromosome segregation ATPase
LDKYSEKLQEYWENQRKGYEDIINAQKELIDLKEEQANYEKTIADKTKEINNIESRMTDLQRAASTGDRTAQAELDKLAEEAADKKEDLSDTQHDHEVDLQKDALDKALDDNDKIINAKLEGIKQEYEAQKTNAQNLYNEVIRLTADAKKYTVQEYSDAIDEIAAKMAQNGTTWSSDYINGLKTVQNGGNNANGVYSVLGSYSEANKSQNTSSLSGLNKFVASQGYNTLSKDKMIALAQSLGLYDINNVNLVGTDEIGKINKDRIKAELEKILKKGR